MKRILSQKRTFVWCCTILVSIGFFGCGNGNTITLCPDCPVPTPTRTATVTTVTVPQGALITSQNIPFTVTVSPSGATGTVAITDITNLQVSNPTPQGSGILSGGSAVISLRPFNAGTRVYRVEYSGDSYYSPSQTTITVVVATPLTTASCGLGDAVYVLRNGTTTLVQPNFSSVVADQEAVCAQNSGTVLNLNSPNISKTASGNYDQFDPSGVDAGVLAYGNSATSMSGATINLQGVPFVSALDSTYAVFASGNGAMLNVSNASITATNSFAAAGVGNNGTLNLVDSTVSADGVSLVITEGGTVAISNTSISSTHSSPQFIFQALTSDNGKAAHLRILGGSVASTISGAPPGLPCFAISGNQSADIYLSQVDLSRLSITAAQTLLAVTDGGTVSLTLDHQAAQGIIQTNAQSSLTLMNGSSLNGDFLGGSVTLDASSSLILHSGNAWQTFNDPGGIQGTQVLNVTYSGRLSYSAALNPQLGGLTYALQGGGTLVPY